MGFGSSMLQLQWFQVAVVAGCIGCRLHWLQVAQVSGLDS
jgi:hypothetical protein